MNPFVKAVNRKMTTTESKIIIVGAGVLGLSTALHLARGGYKNVTVFDRCDYATRHYDPAKGCSSASADINKIFRADYLRHQNQYVSDPIVAGSGY